ncbi:MAG: ATP-binding protein, partial [Acidobacteriota bacterium]|nr:ATP-binding protein [Acidobacteriota bacterium]
SSLRQLEMEVAQLQKMQLLGQITGGIAHDFRNLLTVILGSGELMREMLREGDPARAELDAIVEAATRATALTSQLLGFGKRASGIAVDVDVALVIDGMRGILARMAGEDVRITTQLDEGLGIVLADPVQVEQIVANLVMNARDAMPDGGVVRIEACNVAIPGDAEAPTRLAPGPYCRLRVSDSGCGMSADTLRRALAFHFTTKPDKGTGLGLPTCERIARHHGGAIDIRSALGTGTDVTVYLPRAPGARRALSLVRVTGADPRGTETVLVIEDDETVRKLLKRSLEGLGYGVLAAATSRDAIATYHAHGAAIDAVLCDVVLPDVGGPETVRQILAMAAQAPAVLFMSGHTDHALLRDGTLQDASNFMQKPLVRATIARKLREVIDAA